MRLIDNAEKVLKRAWSVRIGFAGIVLGAAATVLPLATPAIPAELLLPFCGVTFIVIIASMLFARFVHQDNVAGDPDGNP